MCNVQLWGVNSQIDRQQGQGRTHRFRPFPRGGGVNSWGNSRLEVSLGPQQGLGENSQLRKNHKRSVSLTSRVEDVEDREAGTPPVAETSGDGRTCGTRARHHHRER